MPRTKIVCTIGPATDDEASLRSLFRAGMDVARINFSHGSHEDHRRRISRIRAIAQAEGRVVSVLGDLQGPKWRVGAIEGGYVIVHLGSEITLTTRDVPGDDREIHLPHAELIRAVQAGQRLLLDDGLLEFAVVSASDTDLECRVVHGGTLSSHKGVSAPGARLETPALTPKDGRDVEFAVQVGVDFLALSFVKGAGDVRSLRELLDGLGSSVPIVSKIETVEALENFEAILALSDAVMIARGDLGVETPAEELPFVQKDLIRRCYQSATPVVTATQMLNSMIFYPRPTRAETSDVANAILDGTSAVMLSAETAAGEHPVATVETMARIAQFAERKLPHEDLLGAHRSVAAESAAEAIAESAIITAQRLDVKAIVAATRSGKTARLIARYRPRVPVLAMTPNPEVHRQLTLVWGVTPCLVERYDSSDDMVRLGVRSALDCGLIQSHDTVVVVASTKPGAEHGTNLLQIHSVP